MISKYDDEFNKKILNELKTKIKKFEDYKESTTFLYNTPTLEDTDLLLNPKMKINTIDEVKKSIEIGL
jgi:glutamyl-tRNA synthetase/nondiscriminating glutamyl-tRNA synthetase